MLEKKGHETRDVCPRALAFIAMALASAILVFMGLLAGMFKTLDRHYPGREANRITMIANTAPQPQLQEKPSRDMNEFRKKEEKILQSYGWENRDAGIIRIPIEQAMKIILQRGLPEVGNGETPLEMRQNKGLEKM